MFSHEPSSKHGISMKEHARKLSSDFSIESLNCGYHGHQHLIAFVKLIFLQGKYLKWISPYHQTI